MTGAPPTIGHQIRDWRVRRGLSQLDLACEAEVSSRHVSFVETGRAAPSREMVLRLSESLDVPLRDRNALLLAAGFAPIFPERALADPGLGAAQEIIDLLLAGHDPYPALAVDRHWNLLAANRAASALLSAIPAALLLPPVNVLRVSLHPDGLGRRILNLAEWRAHILGRVRRQLAASGDPGLARLLEELAALPGAEVAAVDARPGGAIAVPLRLQTEVGVLSLISTTTVFGAPLDVTLAELALETFFPADAPTREALRMLAASEPATRAA
jgi:transcriptional regulator with XRE-family HTH domain